MLTWITALVMSLVYLSGIGALSIPAHTVTAQHAPDSASEEHEWEAFHADAYAEYAAEFDALYSALETRWSKNGRLMMRTGDSGPYKFVKRTAKGE